MLSIHQCFLLQNISIDSSALGRLDYSTMSDQSLMELFITPVQKKHLICRQKDGFDDLSEWKGVIFNESGNISEICWKSSNLGGEVDFEWLPPTIEKLDFIDNRLRGSVPCNVLPAKLKTILFSRNQYSGTLDLSQLPRNLETFDAKMNTLTGSLDLTNLPDHIESLVLTCNRFSGSICLTQLPKTIKMLGLGGNKLSGGIDVTHLPDGVEYFYLCHNSFNGEADFRYLPHSLLRLSVEYCRELSGTIYVTPGLKSTKFPRQRSQIRVITRQKTVEKMLEERDK